MLSPWFPGYRCAALSRLFHGTVINADLDQVVIQRTHELAASLERERIEAGRNQANSELDCRWRCRLSTPSGMQFWRTRYEPCWASYGTDCDQELPGSHRTPNGLPQKPPSSCHDGARYPAAQFPHRMGSEDLVDQRGAGVRQLRDRNANIGTVTVSVIHTGS